MIGEVTMVLKVLEKTRGSPSDAGAARSGSPRDGALERKTASDPSAGPPGSVDVDMVPTSEGRLGSSEKTSGPAGSHR